MRKDSLPRASQKDESGSLLCGMETPQKNKHNNLEDAQTCFSENKCSSHFKMSNSSLQIGSMSVGESQAFVPVQRSVCMQ